MGYPAFVAFLPLPTELLGTYGTNPAAVAFFAATIAMISGFEVLDLLYVNRAGLFRTPPSREVFRYTLIRALTPT